MVVSSNFLDKEIKRDKRKKKGRNEGREDWKNVEIIVLIVYKGFIIEIWICINYGIGFIYLIGSFFVMI